jgi:2-oxo-4-hydroxy-4-carboxy-5-ureidoimidazoline decarboxylase
VRHEWPSQIVLDHRLFAHVFHNLMFTQQFCDTLMELDVVIHIAGSRLHGANQRQLFIAAGGLQGELTADSAREQAGAGLNACTPAEFAELQALNLAYRQRFGWPFIIAVTGLSRTDILAAMRQRLARAPEDEFAEALSQIVRIANIRLNALLDE